MSLGRKVSKDVLEMYEADRKLAETLRDRLLDAAEAEREFRAAQGRQAPEAEQRELRTRFDEALTEALATAEAAERVAMGPKTYTTASQDPKTHRAAEIAARKARAKWDVRPFTDEVDRLRTARESHRLSFKAGPTVAV
jgi:hypothetical protein